LGAGGGLPGLVCALNGAAKVCKLDRENRFVDSANTETKVVLTDYTDAHLLRNLEVNVENNIPVTIQPTIQVKGFIWGRSPADILAQDSTSSPDLFDVIIMSDLIFNHSQVSVAVLNVLFLYNLVIHWLARRPSHNSRTNAVH
jgi:nicotinamide N-methyltransferase